MKLSNEIRRRIRCYKEVRKYIPPFYEHSFTIIEPCEYLLFSENHLKKSYEKRMNYLEKSLVELQQIIDDYKYSVELKNKES